jgi:hypothetical protein
VFQFGPSMNRRELNVTEVWDRRAARGRVRSQAVREMGIGATIWRRARSTWLGLVFLSASTGLTCGVRADEPAPNASCFVHLQNPFETPISDPALTAASGMGSSIPPVALTQYVPPAPSDSPQPNQNLGSSTIATGAAPINYGGVIAPASQPLWLFSTDDAARAEAENSNLLNSGMNHQLRITPTSSPTETHSYLYTATTVAGQTAFDLSPTARAAIIEDSTRLGPTATTAGFLPSAIPVEGQPFFGGPARAFVQGEGSNINLTLTQLPSADFGGNFIHSVSIFTSIEFGSVFDGSGNTAPGASVNQAYIVVDRLVLGLAETAFADNDALPPTLDLAGPNARISVLTPGAPAGGQGRLSYFISQLPTMGTGYALNVSVEQPTPEIANNANPPKATPPVQPTTTFARFPDLIATLKWADMISQSYNGSSTQPYEVWHVQFGALIRSLGLESGNNAIDESAVGWGVSLSGHYAFNWSPDLKVRDALYGSITYGDGIAHYITDLHTPSMSLTASGNDAVLVGNDLEALHDLAYYVGYTHNWSDHWRSTASYSHVTLDSAGLPTKTLYRFGDYASVNIEFHRLFNGPAAPGSGGSTLYAAGPGQLPYTFNIGLEYLYGRLEEASGAAGDDQRISLVAAIYK